MDAEGGHEMKPTQEEVVRVARECAKGRVAMSFEEASSLHIEEVERLATHFYEAGAAAAREAERKARMSFGELHPANPSATCKCEHWQSCAECHPTAHAKATGEKT